MDGWLASLQESTWRSSFFVSVTFFFEAPLDDGFGWGSGSHAGCSSGSQHTVMNLVRYRLRGEQWTYRPLAVLKSSPLQGIDVG